MAINVDPARSGNSSLGDHVTKTSAKVMVNADALFTAVGDVQIRSLWSECYTANNATASTLQYQITPTVGTASTISGATTTLASAIAGTVVVMDGATLAAVPTITASGVALNTTARGVIFKSGVLKTVIGVGSTTGTWKHYIKWEPLEEGAYVYANF